MVIAASHGALLGGSERGRAPTEVIIEEPAGSALLKDPAPKRKSV
jgi:hypothetical protein